ncbi:hypothetical protein U1Q18_027217 [Sarracenia purpurea var. burkii]
MGLKVTGEPPPSISLNVVCVRFLGNNKHSPLNSTNKRREKEYVCTGYHQDPEGRDDAGKGLPAELPPPEPQTHAGSDDFVGRDVDTDESEGKERREGR